jgi:hypothetical protein
VLLLKGPGWAMLAAAAAATDKGHLAHHLVIHLAHLAALA